MQRSLIPVVLNYKTIFFFIIVWVFFSYFFIFFCNILVVLGDINTFALQVKLLFNFIMIGCFLFDVLKQINHAHSGR